MSSISTNSKTGTRYIQFYLDSKQRKSLYLGAITKRQAQTVRGYIDDLVHAYKTSTAPKDKTQLWLNELHCIVGKAEGPHLPTIHCFQCCSGAAVKQIQTLKTIYWCVSVRIKQDRLKFLAPTLTCLYGYTNSPTPPRLVTFPHRTLYLNFFCILSVLFAFTIYS